MGQTVSHPYTTYTLLFINNVKLLSSVLSYRVHLLAIADIMSLSAIAVYTKHTHIHTHIHAAEAHTCLRKCQVWLTLRPTVMFKAIHLRLQGIAKLIRTGTTCPIDFPGLPSTSHKPSTMIYCTVQEEKKSRGYTHSFTNLLTF